MNDDEAYTFHLSATESYRGAGQRGACWAVAAEAQVSMSDIVIRDYRIVSQTTCLKTKRVQRKTSRITISTTQCAQVRMER